MRVKRRLGCVAVGILFAGFFSGVPAFPGDAPMHDGSKITIISPKDGDQVSDNFELKYELSKELKGAHAHAHVYVDDVYQKGFKGRVKGLDRGTHKITVAASSKDHDLLEASHTIIVEVP